MSKKMAVIACTTVKKIGLENEANFASSILT